MNNDELLMQISQLLDKKLKPLNEEQRMTNERINRVELLLENDVLLRLQTIESCYTDTYRRYVVGLEQIEAMQTDIDILKRVVSEHSKRLQNN